MMNELLNLWITRIDPAMPLPGVGRGEGSIAGIADLITKPGHNTLVIYKDMDTCRRNLIKALERLAIAEAKKIAGGGEEVTGWLVIDIPIPNRVDSTALLHRMVRRLYFTAVLHGLGEIKSLREAVQSLRMSYFQTRGKVTTGHSTTRAEKAGAGIEVSLSLTKPITGKLTAAEEVSAVESLSAEMQQMTLMETEDQLLYDLQILTQLRLHIDRYAKRFPDPMIPRLEHVKGFFKHAYAPIGPKRRFRLQPAFVFEVTTVTALVALMNFLSEAVSLPGLENAELIVLGGPLLSQAFDADKTAGHPVFRSRFKSNSSSSNLTLSEPMKAAIGRFLNKEEEFKLTPEVVQILHTMNGTSTPTIQSPTPGTSAQTS